MTNEDKSIVIAGTMFLALSTALAITGLFFMQALGIGVIVAVVTYVFFDTCYYTKKDWMLSANSKQSKTKKSYVLTIYN